MKKILLICFLAISVYSAFDVLQKGNYEKAINGNAKLADAFCSFYSVFDTGKVLLKNGNYVPVTKLMIYNFCKIGAKGGFPNSQNKFGEILLAEKVPSLNKEAEKYFLLSAKQGNSEAKLNLAHLYTFEKGFINHAKAAKYYEEIVDLNQSVALCSFAILYIEGKGVLRDYNKAKELVKRGYDNAKYEPEKKFCSSVWKTYSLDTK